MSEKSSRMSVFNQIKSGLEDSIEYSQGKLSLLTTELPAAPPKMDPREVVSIRKGLRMSQAVFAATLNVSKRTVQSWEQGLRAPSDAALRLLEIASRRPDVVREIMGEYTASMPTRRGNPEA